MLQTMRMIKRFCQNMNSNQRAKSHQENPQSQSLSQSLKFSRSIQNKKQFPRQLKLSLRLKKERKRMFTSFKSRGETLLHSLSMSNVSKRQFPINSPRRKSLRRKQRKRSQPTKLEDIEIRQKLNILGIKLYILRRPLPCNECVFLLNKGMSSDFCS